MVLADLTLARPSANVRRTWSSQRVLTLALFGESGREDEAILEVDRPRGFAALVCHGLLFDLTRPWVDAPDLPIFASKDDFGTVPIPASRIDLKDNNDQKLSFRIDLGFKIIIEIRKRGKWMNWFLYDISGKQNFSVNRRSGP